MNESWSYNWELLGQPSTNDNIDDAEPTVVYSDQELPPENVEMPF
jgi:hypothetical protein